MTLQPDRPAYRQIADRLRAQIASGELRPGDRVPRAVDLAKDYVVAPMTARQALDLLVQDGLVEPRPGRGTFVRQPPTERLVTSERYAKQITACEFGETLKESAFTREQGITWDELSIDCDFGEAEASPEVAARLGVESGARVFRRGMVLRARGEAERIQVSWFPLQLVADTPMTDPTQQPWPGGVIAELMAIGVRPKYSDEYPRARRATAHEAHLLRLSEGAPVLDVTRVGRDAALGVIEVVKPMVLPGDRALLHYRLEF